MAFGTGTFSSTQRKPYQRGMGMQPAQPGQLQAPQPLTQNGAIAQQKNLQGLQTGQFGDVQSAQNATSRANALRQYQAIQSSRASAVRGNLSTEQAQRAQDQSLAAANAQNLTAQNSVNAMQRQYGQDALNRADIYENDAYGKASDERNYQDKRGDVAYDRNYNEGRDAIKDARYTDETQYGRGRDSVMDKRYDTETAYSQGRDLIKDSRYTDETNYMRGRDTVLDQRYGDETQYGRSRDALKDSRYTDETQYNRGIVADETQYSRGRDALKDSQYADETQYNRGIKADDTSYSRGRDALSDQVNADQTVYSRGRDALSDKTAADSTAYNRNRDSYLDSRYESDVAYNRDEAKRLEGKGDVNTLISSVTDPRAQNLLRSVQASGGDVRGMYNTMLDQGTIKPEYASASPGTVAYQAKVDELKSYYPDKSDAEIKAMALQERTTEHDLVQQPLVTATKTQAGIDAANRLENGKGTPEDFTTGVENGNIQKYTSATLPIDNGAKALIGKTVSLGGQQFQVVANGRVTNNDAAFGTGTHTSYTVVQSPDGKIMYNYKGTLTDKPPVTKMGADAGKAAVYNPTTKTVSYVKQ